MNTMRLLTTAFGIFIATALLVAPADAQSAPQTATQKKRAPAAKPPETPVKRVVAQPVILPAFPLEAAQVEQKCLRALNGTCTNPLSVESARLRAEIIPAVRVSYFGTPAGTVGGSYIPFERLFQDNPLLFGLPTFTATFPCCITRSK
jgi:hypothetical protein